MATFKNVSGEDREVSVDGRSIFVADGDSFDVADEHAPTLRHQPHFLADDDTLARWKAEDEAAKASDEAKRNADEEAAKAATKATTKGGKN